MVRRQLIELRPSQIQGPPGCVDRGHCLQDVKQNGVDSENNWIVINNINYSKDPDAKWTPLRPRGRNIRRRRRGKEVRDLRRQTKDAINKVKDDRLERCSDYLEASKELVRKPADLGCREQYLRTREHVAVNFPDDHF